MSPDTIKVYVDAADPPEFRWRRIARNGREVSSSGEGYSRREDAVKAAKREAGEDPDVVIEVSDA